MTGSSLSNTAKEAIRTATSIEDLADIDFSIPGVPPSPGIGRYDLPEGTITRIDFYRKNTSYSCSNQGCSGSDDEGFIGWTNIYGGFEIKPVNGSKSTPSITRYAEGSIRGIGTVNEVWNDLLLYEDRPQFGRPGSGSKVAGTFLRIAQVTYDPGTIWVNNVSFVDVSIRYFTLTPSRLPNPSPSPSPTPVPSPSPSPIPPPCDIPITSNFDAGYFCMTRAEYSRFTNEIDRVEENLSRFQ